MSIVKKLQGINEADNPPQGYGFGAAMSREKSLQAELDKKANGADTVDHGGKSYRRRGPKDSVSQPGKWLLVKSKVKEGMDDADDGAPLNVSGPRVATNPAAEAADALAQAAERLAGFIGRAANANNPQLAAKISQLHMAVSDVCEEIEAAM